MPDSRSPTLAAGDLRQVVAWRQYDPVATEANPDPYGRRVPVFVDKGNHRARVRPLTGAALVNANQLKPAVWYEVTTRALAGLKGLDQLVCQGMTLTVEYALNWDLTGAFMSVHATAEVLNPNPSPS